MPAMARAGPGGDQEAGIPSDSPTWVSRDTSTWALPIAISGTLPGPGPETEQLGFKCHSDIGE